MDKSTPNNVRPSEGRGSRRTPRRVFQHPIGVLTNGEYRVLQALQLSEGGLLFVSDRVHRPGEQLIATLILPGGGTVVARGEIAYERAVTPAGRSYGVKFSPLAINARRWIRNYVTAKTQSEAETENLD